MAKDKVRRSMGNKKVDHAAVRGSMAGSEAQNENRRPPIRSSVGPTPTHRSSASSGKTSVAPGVYASSSRLPIPHTTGAGVRGRSSSTEKGRQGTQQRSLSSNQLNCGSNNAFRTPRCSSSSGWTPTSNRSSGNRQPLNSLQNLLIKLFGKTNMYKEPLRNRFWGLDPTPKHFRGSPGGEGGRRLSAHMLQ